LASFDTLDEATTFIGNRALLLSRFAATDGTTLLTFGRSSGRKSSNRAPALSCARSSRTQDHRGLEGKRCQDRQSQERSALSWSLGRQIEGLRKAGLPEEW